MAKKITLSDQIDALETLGDCAKFRIDVLRKEKRGPEKRAARKKLNEKKQALQNASLDK